MPDGVQALFLHRSALSGTLAPEDRPTFEEMLQAQKAAAFTGDELWWVPAYEHLVSEHLESAPELSVRLLEQTLQPGDLVTLTQALYFAREDDESSRFHAALAADDNVALEGRLTRSRLIGSTGHSELSGRKRMTLLAYVTELEVEGSKTVIGLRPLFIGRRVRYLQPDLPPIADDRREVFAQQIDQFAAVQDKRPKKAHIDAVGKISEDDVIKAFAEILGEAVIPGHAPNENSDLYTSRLTIDGQPTATAFAFKGPGQPGTLHVADMGKRGDQAIRLLNEPVDLIVVQHHAAIAPTVRNLMSDLARSRKKRFMVIDGQTTGLILSAYGHLT